MGEEKKKTITVTELSVRDRRLLQRLVRGVERIASTVDPAGPGEADLGDEFDSIVSAPETRRLTGQIRHGGAR